MSDGVGGKFPTYLIKAILYGGAPFFCWPHKPLLNHIEGRSYERAYLHFRRDHQDPFNLFCHCLCLILQLLFNYSLLSEVGKGLKRVVNIPQYLPALATTGVWSMTLLRQKGAPLSVRIASIGALVAAYSLRDKLAEHWQKVPYVTAILEMMAVQVFVINKAKDTSGKGRVPINFLQLAKLVVGRLGLQALIDSKAGGSLSGAGSRSVVNTLLAAWMWKVSQDPFGGTSPVKTPFFLSFSGWILGLLTKQPWLIFYSNGFLSSMAQGVAHHHAGELSTLPQLANVSDELAHTTFFPNLLLHSVYQSLLHGKGPSMLSDSA